MQGFKFPLDSDGTTKKGGRLLKPAETSAEAHGILEEGSVRKCKIWI